MGSSRSSRSLLDSLTKKQISFYDRGLGTGWRKRSGNAAGAGISKNIIECYEFIFNNYEAGDRIYLFGFSRGATTVRSLSSFIHLFGILPKSRPELIKRAYKIYRKRNKENRDAAAKEFIEQNHTMWARIHFLGAWDTVAALGGMTFQCSTETLTLQAGKTVEPTVGWSGC